MCEPPGKCRDVYSVVKTRSFPYFWDKRSGNLITGYAATGIEVARLCSRLWYGTREPVALMLREKPKAAKPQGESIEAGRRDGATRSSVETAVMAASEGVALFGSVQADNRKG